MFSISTTVKVPKGVLQIATRAAAERVLDGCEDFYRVNQGRIPVKTGRLRDSLTQRGAADNIAEVLEGPQGYLARYGSRVPYASFPNVRRKIPKPDAAHLARLAKTQGGP